MMNKTESLTLAEENVKPSPIPLKEAFWFWLKLGFISFGGPAGQIAIMHQELVENRRWISESRFLHALNFCMVLPGPEAQQLATYRLADAQNVGRRHRRAVIYPSFAFYSYRVVVDLYRLGRCRHYCRYLLRH
jgi:hypothetical protein